MLLPYRPSAPARNVETTAEPHVCRGCRCEAAASAHLVSAPSRSRFTLLINGMTRCSPFSVGRTANTPSVTHVPRRPSTSPPAPPVTRTCRRPPCPRPAPSAQPWQAPAPRPRSLAAPGLTVGVRRSWPWLMAAAPQPMCSWLLARRKTGRPRAETGNWRSGLRAWLRCPRAPLSLVLVIPAESEAMLWFGTRHRS